MNVRTTPAISRREAETVQKNAALKQLPFLGTRSIPTGLRKDFWRPLATVHFPSGSQGLSAYRQLREFRKRHEHEWDLEGRRYRTNRGIARFIMDQKANTVADLAAVLSIQEPLAKAQEEKFKQDKIQNEETLRSEEARLEELLVKKRELRRSWDEEEARKEFKAVKREKIKMKTVIDKRKKQVAAKAQEEKFEQEKIQNKETMRIEQARLEELRVKQRELRRSLDKEEARKEYEAVKTEKIKLKRVIDKRKKQAAHASDNALRSEGYPAAKQGSKELKQKEVLRFSTKGIKIEWDDVLDAEYAQTWPEEVVHDLMPRKRKQKHFPPSPINPRQLTLSFRPNDDAFTESTQETVTRRPDQQETPKPPLMQRIIDRLRFGRSAST